MPSNIQFAVKDHERLVGLADVERGEKGLTCYTCGDKITVKDGGGQFVNGSGRRNRGKSKHFSHTPSSMCHGEGPAHYQLKTALCDAINMAIRMPSDERNFHGVIQYLCPDTEYGPHDIFKDAPGKDYRNPQMPGMAHGYHRYNLLDPRNDRWDGPLALGRAEREVRLCNGKTRADIAGLDQEGNVLWVIEIKRTSLRRAAVELAKKEGYPLFVIDISNLPKLTHDDPFAEVKAWDYCTIRENLVRGFYPSATETYNMECQRRAFGMGPTDRNWNKQYMYDCRGVVNCGGEGCSDCEEVLLHECGGDEDMIICPDTAYMFNHGIGQMEMYTNPVHLVHSHTYHQPVG